MMLKLPLGVLDGFPVRKLVHEPDSFPINRDFRSPANPFSTRS
jgi:hypothetical protein